jgi:hypothetical protein
VGVLEGTYVPTPLCVERGKGERRSGGGSSSRGSDTGCVVEKSKGIISHQDISCVMAWYARCSYGDNVKRRSRVKVEFEVKVKVVLERMDGLRERCGGVVAWCALSEHGGSEHGGSEREGVSECKREESTQPRLPPPTTHYQHIYASTHLRFRHTHLTYLTTPILCRRAQESTFHRRVRGSAPLVFEARRGAAWCGVAWRNTDTDTDTDTHRYTATVDTR